ncbi:MAG: single-stranded-DNA-specific exonuclease RecJ [Alphaproteobacteria bacterium]|nr:single-stranded-DNA-specific exonuclease RecJ [Alphaproteobacteria bacterium]MCB9791577.1 single-stranded-DNA-specific exonuclease RecJ [Alphaproteobacteria bacterium]
MTAPLSFTGAAWLPALGDEALAERLSRRLGLHPALAACLSQRGAEDEDAALRLLHPDMHALHPPELMLGLPEGLERLRRALAEGEHVRVVTDYDVDGTTSSLILQAALGVLGGRQVSYHIPDRMDEGYGFSVRAADKAAEDGVGLIVTADIGVRDQAAVQRAAERGVDVIVCDHHLPAGQPVPEGAVAVLCPPQDGCPYPNKALAACGVSFKLAQALLAGHPAEDRLLRSLLKLAAIGTVADVVDLSTPENRAIVSLGLVALNEDRHSPGLDALLRVAGVTRGSIDASDLGYRVGPRINAAGRVASATAVVELLTTRDPSRARRRAEELDRLNGERRRIQDRMLRAAEEQVPSPLPAFIVVWGREEAGWHRGVAGIVASRIRDRFNRPCAVVAVTPTGATGSVRSIPQVHALEALSSAEDLLSRFGGHPAAAGFSLPAEALPALAQRLSEAASAQLDGQTPALERRFDVALSPQEVDRGLQEALQRLGPFGKGNPTPRLLLRGARLEGLRVLKDKHLKGRLAGSQGVDVIWWGGAEHRGALERARQPELLGKLDVNVWQGVARLQVVLEDGREGLG